MISSFVELILRMRRYLFALSTKDHIYSQSMVGSFTISEEGQFADYEKTFLHILTDEDG